MTDIYPAFFSATALLKPKNAPPEALFQIGDPAVRNGYRRLYPKPEDVKAAIEAFKKAGMTARVGIGHTLELSGPNDALEAAFGVRLIGKADRNGRINFSLVNIDGLSVSIAQPLSGHPLHEWLVGLYARTHPAVLNNDIAPRHPERPQEPWGKSKRYHLWPHELRQRLGADTSVEFEDLLQQPSKLADRQRKPGVFTLLEKILKDRKYGLGFAQTVHIVDSGINVAHPYFDQLGMMPVKINHEGRNIRVDLEIAEMAGDWSVLRHRNRFLLQLARKTLRSSDRFNAYFRGDPRRNALPRDAIANRSLRRVLIEFEEIVTKRHFFNYFKLYNHVAHAKLEEVYVQLKRAIKLELNFTIGEDRLEALRQYVDFVGQREKELVGMDNWLKEFDRGRDPDGHGTGMAASILGVARLATIRMHRATVGLPSAYAWIAPTSDILSDVFDDAVKGSTDFGGRRVISNSWGTPVPDSELAAGNESLIAEWNRWYAKIGIAGKDNVIIFSSGNSGDTGKTHFQLQATIGGWKQGNNHGYWGAIIVGGAWDKGDEAMPSDTKSLAPRIRLSNAAYGKSFVLFTPAGQPPIEAIVPDCCALAGPLEGDTAPYVYLPATDNEWHFGGGGTSSAAAQVAGISACLLATYSNLSAYQIREALIVGGSDIEPSHKLSESISHQDKSVDEIWPPFDGPRSPLKRVNIAGAFRKAKELSGSSNV